MLRSARHGAALALRLITVLWLLGGCQGVYYDTMEKLGYHKRDLLLSRVEEARAAQQQAKQQFQSTLQTFSVVLGFRGGELQQRYETLSEDYEKSETRARAVDKRIDQVEAVAGALFDEWRAELKQYTNVNLRRESERKLEQTRQRYAQLIGAMRGAQSKTAPVLAALRDQVLFLKHNLNAQAIASLQGELASIQAATRSLIKAMEASIAEADAFVKTMGSR